MTMMVMMMRMKRGRKQHINVITKTLLLLFAVKQTVNQDGAALKVCVHKSGVTHVLRSGYDSPSFTWSVKSLLFTLLPNLSNTCRW